MRLVACVLFLSMVVLIAGMLLPSPTNADQQVNDASYDIEPVSFQHGSRHQRRSNADSATPVVAGPPAPMSPVAPGGGVNNEIGNGNGKRGAGRKRSHRPHRRHRKTPIPITTTTTTPAPTRTITTVKKSKDFNKPQLEQLEKPRLPKVHGPEKVETRDTTVEVVPFTTTTVAPSKKGDFGGHH